MQGTVIDDFVLLLLLVLFFGWQQRGRPQKHFRFWFAGWIFVVASYLVWSLRLQPGRLAQWQVVLRVDLLLIGLLLFTLSFPLSRLPVRQTLQRGAWIAVPLIVAVDLQVLRGMSHGLVTALLVTLLIIGHGAAILVAHRELSSSLRWRRGLIFALCGLAGLLMSLLVLRHWNIELSDAVLTETCVVAGLLYAARYGRRSLSGTAGTLGFISWGAFYVLPTLMAAHPRFLVELYGFWSVPKCFVAFAMTLNIFEASEEEKTQLVAKYRTLYEDFRVMYEGHPHPMWIYDAQTGKILSANMTAVLDFGFSVVELQQMRVGELELPKDAESDRIDRLLPEPPDGHRTRYRRKDGSCVWVNVVEHHVHYQGVEARLMTARDITERLKINQDLALKAQHDELTGLPNRMLLQDRMEQTLAQCIRSKTRAALLTIDVDHFKRINDTYGHLVGDLCLKAVAARMKSKIRQVDTLARTGGEEFTGIIGNLSTAADARLVTTTLLRLFEEPLRLPDLDLSVTVSIGVALFPDDAQDPDTLRKMSDDALYHAKRNGRNRSAFAPEGAAERTR